MLLILFIIIEFLIKWLTAVFQVSEFLEFENPLDMESTKNKLFMFMIHFSSMVSWCFPYKFFPFRKFRLLNYNM